MLGLTIMLETGPVEPFTQVGHDASYCRCVGSEHLSNGKRKGHGHTKSGNKYLAWAYLKAANFAVRYIRKNQGPGVYSLGEQPHRLDPEG